MQAERERCAAGIINFPVQKIIAGKGGNFAERIVIAVQPGIAQRAAVGINMQREIAATQAHKGKKHAVCTAVALQRESKIALSDGAAHAQILQMLSPANENTGAFRKLQIQREIAALNLLAVKQNINAVKPACIMPGIKGKTGLVGHALRRQMAPGHIPKSAGG